VTPQLLFGSDVNRNGQTDEHELMIDTGGTVSTDPRGWSAYLTLYSVEANLTPEGQPKVYLNTNDLNKLVEDLSAVGFADEWITFIVAYRQAGPAQASTRIGGTQDGAAANPAAESASGELNMEIQPSTPIGTILDLIGAEVEYTFDGTPGPQRMASPFTALEVGAFLPKLMDYVTVNPSATIPGRINVNQCLPQILMGIPGMTQELADKILAARSADAATADPGRAYETWLLSEGIVTLAEMKVLLPFICGGGDAYRAQVVGYVQGGQASCRAEVVVEATSPMPRVVLWRDLTHLGRGYSLETLGVDYTQ
jgi:DNA uptake protein ComE-like DNA-binding protein